MERKIRYIKQIAQCGNINKAAEKLYITPSALSKYLTKVEEELNVKLFDRVGKRFVLTHAGERYLYWAERIQSIQTDMETELADITAGSAGKIRVGIMLDDVVILTKRILKQFYREFPNMRVEIYEKQNKDLRRMLDDHKLDFAILHEYKVSEHAFKHVLAPIYPVLVTSRNSGLIHFAVKKIGFPYPWLPYDVLQKESFVVPFEDMDAYGRFEEFKAACGFSPKIILQAQNVHLQTSFLEEYNALLCSYDQLVKNNFNMSALQMFSYGDITMPKYLILAYRKDHNLTPACVRLIQLCEEQFGVDMREDRMFL